MKFYRYLVAISAVAVLSTACSDELTISVADTSSCQNDDACDGDRVCRDGVCILEVGQNGDCSAENSVCTVGKCVDGKCKVEESEKLGKVGDKCTKSSECNTGLFCDNKKCAEKLDAGKECHSAEACKSGICEDETCLETKGLGEDCGPNTICSENLWCNTENKCAKLPEAGEKCDRDIGCAGGAICSANICVKKNLTDGAPCDLHNQCDTSHNWFCDENTSTCLNRVKLGDACDALHVCASDQVCANGKCLADNGQCTNDNDCNKDTYCCTSDECSPKGLCIPYGEGPRGDVNDQCVYETVPGMFEAAIQCEWKAPATNDPYSGHANVLMTPLVIDTPYDSGTANEIVFTTYNNGDGDARSSSGTTYDYYGVIRIMNAETCELHATLNDDLNHMIGSTNLAIADVDKDGKVEIFAGRGSAQTSGYGGGIVAWHWVDADPNADPNAPEAKGHYAVWWPKDGHPETSTVNSIELALHDINDDDRPEIIATNGEVFDSFTGKRLNPGQALGEISNTPTLGDLDGDGKVEIIGVVNIYEWDSENNNWVAEYNNVLGNISVHHAYADFGTENEDGSFDYEKFDGVAEIVSCGNGYVAIATIHGKSLMKETTNLDNQRGGPCTVGDFDGDGFPEVATAFADLYAIFDPRCKAGDSECKSNHLLWTMTSQDHSSGSTGSSLFDFDGDGAMEAVYADECYTRVYDGKTGEVLFSSYHSSATWWEYPVIADVDNDESAEIIMGSNNAMNCPTEDPIHRGLKCQTNADCKSNNCVKVHETDTLGLCRCTADNQCNYRTDAQGNILNEYACLDGLNAEDKAGGKVCRAIRRNSEKVTGVRVMRDSLDRWTSSRNIWNQHTYNITNILDDMTIPKTSSWVQNFRQTDPKLNNFRQNVQGSRGRNVAPDITGRFTGNTCTQSGSDISVKGVICNRGTKMVASLMPATFYLADEAGERGDILCVSYTTANVPVGGCLEVSCNLKDKFTNVDQVVGKEIIMVANDDGNGGRTTVECNDNNNEDRTTVDSCPVY